MAQIHPDSAFDDRHEMYALEPDAADRVDRCFWRGVMWGLAFSALLRFAACHAWAGVELSEPKPEFPPVRFVEAPTPAGGWLLWRQCFARPAGELERCLVDFGPRRSAR